MRRENKLGNINFLLIILIIVFVAFIYVIYSSKNDQNNILKSQEISELEANITTENDTNSYVEDRYFYNQLNDGSRIMYNTILNNLPELESGNQHIEFPADESITDKSFQSAWDALIMDRPGIFYADTPKISLITMKKTFLLKIFSMSYTMKPKDDVSYFYDNFKSTADVKNGENEMKKLAEYITENATGTTYQKVKFVHDWIIKNVDYDKESEPSNGTAYGSLVLKKAVCEGYAVGFKYLLDALKIPCVVVFGDAENSQGDKESHAWNYVKMNDGNWYGVDTTWDDPIIIGAGSGIVPDKIKYANFLQGKDIFLSNRLEDADVSKTGQDFKYPQLAKNDYNGK